MKKVVLLTSTGVLFSILGCSGNSQKAVSKGSLPVVHASTAPANASSPATASVTPLPEVSAIQSSRHTWHSEDVKDLLGNAVLLKQTSLDGKFDLVILQKGTHSFLSFVKHSRWESVHDRPAKGKLMNLRAKFENGEEKRIEWDELFIQDMMKHTAMLLEVEPGVTTQFDVTGLAREIDKARTPKPRAVLAAQQTHE